MRSLQRHLLNWVLGALSLGALSLALVTYVVTLDEMNEVFDETLRQTALALADYERSDVLTPQRPTSPPPNEIAAKPGDSEIVTATWALDGSRRFISDPRVNVPITRTNGLASVRVGDTDWYVYTVVEANGIVQAAQRAGARQQAAAESASKMFVPLFLLVVLIGVLLVVALRRGLQPLDLSVQDVAARSASSLRPIAKEGLPREIHPMVDAINELLQRLGLAFDTQKRFVADAAHELRTPITALRLQLQLLRRANDGAERDVAAHDLAQGIERSEHLIQQLLHLSRVEPGADTTVMEAVSLAQLARSVVGAFSIKAEHRGIDLGALCSSETMVDGDPHQLKVMLNNLVDNALRHTPRGGLVDVVACTLDGHPTLRVVDSGPGIPAELRVRVFDRFYRGEASPHNEADLAGSGLGLSIVKAIAERHGASIELLSSLSSQGLECRIIFVSRDENISKEVASFI